MTILEWLRCRQPSQWKGAAITSRRAPSFGGSLSWRQTMHINISLTGQTRWRVRIWKYLKLGLNLKGVLTWGRLLGDKWAFGASTVCTSRLMNSTFTFLEVSEH
jgi:hypothetical protein